MSSALLSLLSDDDRRIIGDRLRAFGDEWRPGLLVEAARALPTPGSPLRLPLLAHLVRLDLQKRWASAEPITVEEYLQLYPEVAVSERALLELLTAEHGARQTAGQPLGWETFAKRFPHLTALIRQRLEPTQSEGSEANTKLPESNEGVPSSAQRQAQRLPEQFGRYRIVKRLGRGGMGAVYLAVDTQLERQVALKVPLFDSANATLLDRFYREARLAATLHHPHLCPIHDVGAIGGIHYLTMPYIDGEPLSAWIKPGQFVPERLAVTLVQQAALAVHEAHQKGIVHRDLKPANIMIDRRGEPIIMDFGLARRSSADEVRLTQSNTLLGTPVYMSPEQASAGKTPVGPASDVYSLGVILYELLTGRVPFDGSMTDVLVKIVIEPPPAPSCFRPGLDERLEAICLRALAKEVAERPASMAAFARELGDWLHQPAHLVPVEEPQPLPAPRRDSDRTEPLKSRPRRAGPAQQGSAGKWLLGCAFLLTLACGGFGLSIWYGVPKVVGWFEGLVANPGQPASAEWTQIDRDWRAPPTGTSGEKLLPPEVSAGVGWTWQRTSLDTRANLQEYQLDRPGHHATYSGFTDHIDVYAWHLPTYQKNAVFEAVLAEAKQDRFSTIWGKKDGSALTVKANRRRTTVWYRDEWLYLATGTEMADTEELLIGVIRAVSGHQPERGPGFP